MSNWREQARCGRAVADGEISQAMADKLFFDWGRPNGAQKFCNNCPVTKQCRQFAERAQIPYGIYGGEQAAHRRERLGIDLAGERQERIA